MLEKLKAKLEAMRIANAKPIDPKQFNDSIALLTQWYPLRSGGANFKTNVLIKVSSSLYRYQLSMGGKFFLGMFGFFGLIALLVSAYLFLTGKFGAGLFLLSFGSIFGGLSIFLYKTLGIPKVFDAKMGIYWSGHKQPQFAGDQKSNQELVYFSKIHALQVLSKRVRSKNGSYKSYEVNLVMRDGSRLNLVDHGNQSEILYDVETLSAFMGKPVWNVSA